MPSWGCGPCTAMSALVRAGWANPSGVLSPAGIPPGPPTITDQQMNPTDLTHEAIGAATTPGGFSFLELFLHARSSSSS